eukprot:g2486.t1
MKVGFRAFDTAQAYQWGYREHELGEAWEASGLPRSELFLQTKVHPDDLIRMVEVFPSSLERLRTEYVDALLMHRPGPGWRAAWGVMEGFVKEGKVRHIGVSNFDAPLLRELLDTVSQTVKPAVVQNWMDPFHQDAATRELCRERGVVFQAFSSLGNQWQYLRDLGGRGNPVLMNPVLTRIAGAHRRSVPQVVLRWQQQLGVAVIPASRNPDHQLELSRMAAPDFELSAEEMAQIAALDGQEPGSAKAAGEHAPRPVSFQSAAASQAVLSWVNVDSGEETEVGRIKPGGELALSTYVGHRFVARGDGWQQVLVIADGTETLQFSDDPQSEL